MDEVPAEPPLINGWSPIPAERVEFTRVFFAFFVVLASGLLLALHIQSFFDDPKFRGVLISPGMQDHLRGMILRHWAGKPATAELSLYDVAGPITLGAISVWIIGALVFSLVTWSSPWGMLWYWGVRFLWIWLLGVFELLWAASTLPSAEAGDAWRALLVALLPSFQAFAWGGWFASALGIVSDRNPRLRRLLAQPFVVWLAALCFAAVFSTLSILQYRVLMVPHGDTAMYEEHLWNLLHGKGFRSQLDGGRLFFGEHLEVIHLLLLPIYVLYPCLPTLNVCLSLGLAAGAIAVRGIAVRLIGSSGAANWLALAYLLYAPLQYLNLEASLKTFRPENFGVPLLLFAIWSLEAGRYRTMLALFGLTLLCKEDYAIPVGMLGLYLAVHPGPAAGRRRVRLLGLSVAGLSALYLVFVLCFFIPMFRAGPPHYMAYYPNLGKTPVEIVHNALREPGLLLGPILEYDSLLLVFSLVAPLAFLPLIGLGRFSTLIPTLISILLIQLKDARTPLFHFHAPLVPILLWSAAEGAARLGRTHQWLSRQGGSGGASDPAGAGNSVPSPGQGGEPSLYRMCRMAAMCALVSGFFAGKSPLSLKFYDPTADIRGFGQLLYVPDGLALERVRAFERLMPLIPSNASVAATDYVRPRFTHHRECHEYGVGGLKAHVKPESVDYIVIDLLGPYSDWVSGQRAIGPEQEPERWEPMHWEPLGEFFFRVLRRRQ